jgi:hypothetical protein
MSLDKFLSTVTTPIAWLPLVVALIGGPLVIWWLVEPGPLEVRYVAPTFSSEEAQSRDEAEKHAVLAVKGGTQVYRYIEYCVRRPFTGTARRSWVNDALVWHAPDVPTQLSRVVGCRSASIMVDVPTSSPTRTFYWVNRIEVPVNPIRDDVIEFPPIPLTILAPSK